MDKPWKKNFILIWAQYSNQLKIFNPAPFLIFLMVAWNLRYKDRIPQISWLSLQLTYIYIFLQSVGHVSKIRIINVFLKCGAPSVPFEETIIQMVRYVKKLPASNQVKSQLTWKFQRPPMSSFLSKHVGSKSSSKQHLMAPSPLIPAPTTATRFLAIVPQIG